PVLVDEARMPRADELPEAIRPLARRNAVRLTHERFRTDTQALITALQNTLKEAVEPKLLRRWRPSKVVSDGASVAELDDRLFAEVEKANTAEAYEYYLDQLPQGRSVMIARFRLKTLRAFGPPAPAPSPQESGQREERPKEQGHRQAEAQRIAEER